MSVQRKSSPATPRGAESDLETTAELPVLDVAAYEAAAAAEERGSNTDTWIIQSPVAREREAQEAAPGTVPAPATAPSIPLVSPLSAPAPVALAPGAAVADDRRAFEDRRTPDEKRTQLEVSLHSLSDNLREVEERLTRKGQRLTEIEQALAQANAARAAAEQHSQQLTAELAKARAAVAAAEGRIAELQRGVDEREATNTALKAHDVQFEEKLALRDKALALVQKDLTLAHEMAASYLESLRSLEGRRGLFQELSTTLYWDIDERDTRLSHVSGQLTAANARVRDLEANLIDRGARIAKLEKEVGSMGAAIKATEGQQSAALAAKQAEFAEVVAQRATLTGSINSLESRLAEAVARGADHETHARTAQTRCEELEAAGAAQRKRVEQLESEMTTIRAELLQRTTALQEFATERTEHTARITAGDARIKDLEYRIDEQQDFVRMLQADSNASVARAKELEGDLRAAEDMINRLETDLRTRNTRLDELEKTNQEWRATVEEARHALTDRDSLIRRLEEETANSAVLLGAIQQKLESTGSHDIAPDGNRRLLIRAEGDSEVVHVLGRKTSVGRTPDNDLQIDAKFISRHHAVILAGPAHTIIEDLNSTNGVLVNGRRITRQTLKDGDSVVIGKTVFRFAVRPGVERRN
jgi:chromosome segregation ATPase